MAHVTVRLFGVLRLDTSISQIETDAACIDDVYSIFDGKITFKNTLVYLNGRRCAKKKTPLNDGDEIWIMSPASGG